MHGFLYKMQFLNQISNYTQLKLNYIYQLQPKLITQHVDTKIYNKIMKMPCSLSAILVRFLTLDMHKMD
jgi:hypothetical protein